jgi:hypothetical protein
LGAVWSLDAKKDPLGPRRVVEVASLAILLQVVLIYSMNAFFKLQSGQWTSGEAIQYTFNIDRFSTPMGRLMAHMPPLLLVMGWSWLVLLVCAPLLLLSTGRLRALVVLAFASFHLGMLLFMRLGVFPLVSIAALLPFLPANVWDQAQTMAKRLVSRFNRSRKNSHRPTDPALDPTSSPLPDTTGLSPFTRMLRSTRYARTPVVTFLLAILLLWSSFSLGVVAFPQPIHDTLSGHERGWAMFANPSRSDVWYVAPAITQSGLEVDALHGEITPWHEPAHVDPLFPDIRWRKFLAEFHRIEGGDLPYHFAAYLCHDWNTKHDDPLVELTIYRIDQPIRLDGPNPPGTATVLIAYSCI